MMHSITNFFKITCLLASSGIFLLAESNSSVLAESNKSLTFSIDRSVLNYTLLNIENTYKVLERKYEECEKERRKNVITDFDFSNPVIQNINLDSWIIYYDLLNTNNCVYMIENKIVRDIIAFNEIKKDSGIKNLHIPNEIKNMINLKGSVRLEYQIEQIPLKAREYLDEKLNKLFYGRKLRDAYKAYLEKQKKK